MLILDRLWLCFSRKASRAGEERDIQGTAERIHPRDQHHPFVYEGTPDARRGDQVCRQARQEVADVNRVDLLTTARGAARGRQGKRDDALLCLEVPSECPSTRKKSTALTEEERDVLMWSARREGGRYLGNSEIGQRLGIPVSRVKTIIHQACVKLGADNRIEAVLVAARRGEIGGHELLSTDELASIFGSLGPDTLTKMAQLVRKAAESGQLLGKDELIIHTETRQDSVLTKRERDVLILVGRGLTNSEIADTLCMSVHAVRAFLHRACAKLGAHRRADAVLLALMRREIGIGEIHSPDELLQFLAPLGAESVEQMARLVSQTGSTAGSRQVLEQGSSPVSCANDLRPA